MATASKLLSALKSSCPLVMCVQNYVAMDFSANVLLAAGASPAMVNAPQEAEDFTKVSNALSVNIGTALTEEWMQASLLSAQTAKTAGRPWVLDPVGVGVTQHRTQHCVDLMSKSPTVVRGNASEIMALATACGFEIPSTPGMGCKGVDSTASSDVARPYGVSLAKAFKCVVAISGKVDYITDGSRTISCANGTELLTKITAAGCSLSCLCAAYCAVCEGNYLEAVAAAFAHFGAAAERAEGFPEVRGPGTLRVHLMDELFRMTPDILLESAKLTYGEA